jgi:hypothetical protein
LPLPTASELASYLQQDLDTSTATLVLTLAGATFEKEADTKFSITSTTLVVEGVGQPVIALPRYPVAAVSEVRIDGTVLASTEYVVVGQNLYRLAGWGGRSWHPQKVEIDYTFGYASWPDDARAAVLEIAAQAYQSPDQLIRTQIDDYAEQRSAGAAGLAMTPGAAEVAALYRWGGFA